MLLAFFLAAALADWVPARWLSHDPQSLQLLQNTPINCLLLEPADWSADFAAAATKQGIVTLGVVRPNANQNDSTPAPLDAARKAIAQKLTGVVLEGIFAPSVSAKTRAVLADSHVPVVELSTRGRIQFDSNAPILGTYQGLWAGVRAEDNSTAHTGPSAAPWIDTNTGFLRFARAATPATIWIAHQPPPNQVINITRYLQAIGDAALTGARWVISLDADFNRKLLAADPRALRDWKQIAAHLQFYEDHKDWRNLRAHSELALVEDAGSGALLSGGVLDMIAVKHTPVQPIPYSKISPQALEAAKMAVDADPSALTPDQLAVLKAFTKSGGTLLTGPPDWKFQSLQSDAITLGKSDLDKLDGIWKELNSMTGRRNMGARLFNVSSMLSNLVETPDRKQLVLHLVNYSDYPAENLTAHVLGKFTKAKLYRPNTPPVDLELYPVDDGTGLDIEKVGAFAAVVLQ